MGRMSGHPTPSVPRAEIVIDLAAIRHNVRLLRGYTSAQMMTVVKADGYGHGMVEVARAARQAGSQWLGVATMPEALTLRGAGDRGRLLAWLATPGESYADALAADVDVAAYSVAQLREIEAAATDRPARVHLKVDTGLSRGGAPLAQWPALVRAAVDSERVEAVGIWSHLAASDEPTHPANAAQLAVFTEAVAMARDLGMEPEVRHLANSAATMLAPEAHFDLVRCGIASYGCNPAPRVLVDTGLRPAMTVRGALVMTKPILAGTGVSYGHGFIASEPMQVGVVPMGYADGIARHASNTAQVLIGGSRRPLLGRVCMDQFVVEAGGAEAGDEVVLFGAGESGEPTAQEWAEWCQTISYEIVTRMGGRQTRRWVNEETGA